MLFCSEDFRKYADFCFKTFGDRVKIWGTINEPMIYIYIGKQKGYPPELQTDPLAPYIAYHNIILAHSEVAKHYQKNYKWQGGKIGISLPIQWSMPYDPNDPTDLAAVEANLELQISWFMNPLVHGDYSEWMKKNVKGLPKFSRKDKEMVKGAFDYIGLNYYSARYFQQTYNFESLGNKVTITYEAHTSDVYGNTLGVQAEGRDDIYDYPEGLKQLLLHMKN
ncbi:Beta-glucosidase 27, partial [Bienertia sinuspersici]